ncbi:MAG: hypothetical protein AAB601_01470 [Patescibacteria group bacterium]
MNRFLRVGGIGAMLAAFAPRAAGQTELELRYFFVPVRVTNVPSEVRLVPVHSDDAAFTMNNGIIERERYATNHVALLSVTNWWECSDGVYLRFGFSIFTLPAFSDAELRNYTTAPGTQLRGPGARFTFCAIAPRGIFGTFLKDYRVVIDLVPAIAISHFLNRERTTSVEASFHFWSYRFFTGWERHGAPQRVVREAYTLGYSVPLTFAFRWRWFMGGITFPNVIPTRTARSFGLVATPVALTFAFSFESYVEPTP